MKTELIPITGDKFTPEEIEMFNNQYLTACKNLSEMVKTKKEIESQEKDIKEQLGEAMDKFGIKSFDNEFIKVTRVAGSDGKKTIDVDGLQKKEPDLYNDLLTDYPKISGKRKPSIKFNVK